MLLYRITSRIAMITSHSHHHHYHHQLHHHRCRRRRRRRRRPTNSNYPTIGDGSRRESPSWILRSICFSSLIQGWRWEFPLRYVITRWDRYCVKTLREICTQVEPLFTDRKNKAGYTATEVACGWEGDIFEVTRPFGQEQWGPKIKIIKKVKCDGPTDKAECRVA